MSELALTGNRVIVTGAAGGLGRAFALAFSKAGAKVVIADMNSEGLLETRGLIATTGAEVLSVEVDVTSEKSCKALAKQVSENLGGVDTLVNNAGLYAGLERKGFQDIEEEVWDKVMQVNVKGVWQMTRAMTPLMQSVGAGSIVNVASATVYSGSALWMHYVASKGAVIAMTRVMAKELGRDNIRANVIAPGFTLTDASNDLIDNAESYGVDRSALGRNAEPEDITGAALYLASGLSGFTTGQTLVVDGGKQFI